ncbi:MAG: DNA metabolism protein [Lachnospiraceae bacterium]|nr:DNA metabolism protein [Lachnospiraceae bacterium]
MKPVRIVQCADSVEGILTAVYDAWAMKYGHEFIKLQVIGMEESVNYELFSEYVLVEPNTDKADKVARSIQKKISNQVYGLVVKAALSNDPRKADAIYHFLVRGFLIGKGVVDHLSDPYVQQIFEMNRFVGNETHFFKGFLRFVELKNGILLGKMEPKSNILELLTPHFADRFAGENFMIVDMKRGIAAIHEKNREWFMTAFDEDQMEALAVYDEQENEYSVLWKAFFKSVAIKERENQDLQRNQVHIRYRKYMTEFEK